MIYSSRHPTPQKTWFDDFKNTLEQRLLKIVFNDLDSIRQTTGENYYCLHQPKYGLDTAALPCLIMPNRMYFYCFSNGRLLFTLTFYKRIVSLTNVEIDELLMDAYEKSIPRKTARQSGLVNNNLIIKRPDSKINLADFNFTKSY